ncbi:hypothetical protein OsI_20342 [Oryza sativa Indica Group]|uniref:EVE domain-containing protein n=1 Tax=Oryza sativa subsp. indica TaxID=39946 RepID=B8AZA3_ORYSI|nr:hypothetical protein OsI_20342 [Oryza sativa Indica Group]
MAAASIIQIAPCDGVCNRQAINSLRAMRRGDCCLFYHSGAGAASRHIVGVVEVAREWYEGEGEAASGGGISAAGGAREDEDRRWRPHGGGISAYGGAVTAAANALPSAAPPARLNQQPAATRPFSVAVRAGLKDTLFPDDPFRGSAGCRPRSARGGWRDLCFVPPLVYAVMGSSRNLGVGPVATSSLLVASIVGGKAEDPDGFHVAVSNHRVHGWHGGRDRAAAAQGLPRHDALHHQEVSTFVSAFVVGAVALIAAAFAIPPATSGTPLPSARSVTAAIDGERRRRPARREIAGGEVAKGYRSLI